MATILQSHHVIESRIFDGHPLLGALAANQLIDKDASSNRLYLPYDKDFADQIDAAPHRGKTDSSYTRYVRVELNRILDDRVGSAGLDDIDALKRALSDVHELQDTLKVGMIHREIFPSIPGNMSREEGRQRNLQSLSDLEQVRANHPDTLKSLRSMTMVESEWAAIIHSERRVMDLIEQVHNGPMLVVRAKGEPPVRDVAGRMEFRLAIADAQASGRLALSDSNAARIQQILVDDLPGIGPLSKHGVYDLIGLSRASYKPLSQGGFATLEAILGEVPQHTLLRAAGPLATGIDLTLSLQRAAELDRQDNPRAAKSELERFAGRSLGGWAAGTTAYLVGAPAAVIASTAAAGAIVLEKAVEWKDAREITHQTDRQNVEWTFRDGSWSRQAQLGNPRDGLEHPVAGRVHASYAKTRELNLAANRRAAEIALANAPTPQDPFDIPAGNSDRTGATNPNWRRNALTEDWERLVNVGTSRDPILQPQTATPERAAELNHQAVARILQNIATGRESIAALYQEHHLAQRGHELGDLPPAVQAALPRSPVVIGSDNTRYERSDDGAWSHNGVVAQGNLAAELELTRVLRQPFVVAHQQRVAQLQAQPPLTPERQQQDELVHRYRLSGIELEPDVAEAIALATQRTRDAHGLTGPVQLQSQAAQVQVDATGQIIKGGTARALRAVDHYQMGADGAYRVVATTSTEDIQQALQEVQASRRQAPQYDVPELRIAPLSPQERDAHQQALSEAHRQGLSMQETHDVARFAATTVHASRSTGMQAPRAVLDAQRERKPAQATEAVPAQAPAPTVSAVAPAHVEPAQPEKAQRVTTPAEPAPSVSTTPDEREGLRVGHRGPEVEFLQYRLHQVGAHGPNGQPVPQDGHFGPETEHAVRQFQQAHGLPTTGVADPAVDTALSLARQSRQEPLRLAEPPASIEQLGRLANAYPRHEASSLQSPVNQEETSPTAPHVERKRTGHAASARLDGAGVGPNAPGRDRDLEQAAPCLPAAQRAFPSDHPDFALFAAIRSTLPAGTSEEKAAEVLHAAKEAGVEHVAEFRKTTVERDIAFVYGNTPGFHTDVSLTTPAPTLEESVQQIQELAQQRALELAQFQKEQQQINQNPSGPVMTLGGHT
ncbi:peptidoglycan-binding protein [Stenotrophomonas sp. C3(2023)]|uniref:peptidoglycan-binding protein n=1 Tax=Stenotrophomonas sp. C3(2023) TaxID=3080277 RepID=UPI00293D1359|nr:peptidoglycan-binding protein [Stenotrophomonas sp. C3(2023)]MDV3469229.1 peptidoglycan-binding protein [Stenotrophomonas sp. C3(2023)]